MISPQDIPLAAMEDMLESVLPIIFIVLYGLSQLLGGKKNKPQRGKGPRPRQAPQPGKQLHPGAPQQAGGEPVGMEQVLRKEVDDFLRRAQGKPPRPEPLRPEPPKPEPRPREVAADRPEAAPRRLVPARERPEMGRLERGRPDQLRPRRVGSAQQRPAAQAGRPATKPAVKVRGTSVSEHVAEHIRGSSREIGQHAENLGAVLAQTDERLEDRLSKKFDHNIGQLQHQELAKAEARVDIAAEIAEMLSKPSGMRQLIIANEILRRPFE